MSVGWPLAAAAGLAFALRNVLGGRLGGMVNPLHVLGGSLWLGRLFVLVVCGLARMLGPTVPMSEREEAVSRRSLTRTSAEPPDAPSSGRT